MQRSAVTPSLFAPDLAATIDFYVETLGFELTGSYNEEGRPPIWSEVALGEARIWLFVNPLERHPTPTFSGLIYVFVDDVDVLAERIAGRVPFEWGPEDQVYGLRELGIRDVNDYYLVFAQDV